MRVDPALVRGKLAAVTSLAKEAMAAVEGLSPADADAVADQVRLAKSVPEAEALAAKAFPAKAGLQAAVQKVLAIEKKMEAAFKLPIARPKIEPPPKPEPATPPDWYRLLNLDGATEEDRSKTFRDWLDRRDERG